jgi:pimeloyl-ACP methyl ester carboxylesterase
VKSNEQTIEVGKLLWFYRDVTPTLSDQKPPVVLLHGLLTQSYSWRETLSELGNQGLRAIAPDWIGFGGSSWPERHEFAYTPDAFITALEDFLSALELTKFSLVVQGFLGSIGLQYALRHPDQIEKLCIINTPLSSEAKLPWKISQLGLPLIGDMLTQDPLMVDRVLEGGGPYQVEDSALDVYRRPFLTSSAAGRAVLATIRQLQLPVVTAEIEAGFQDWSLPTLVLWGLKDPWLPVSSAEQFVKRLANGQLARLEEVGNYGQEDWPEKINAELLPFLRSTVVT